MTESNVPKDGSSMGHAERYFLSFFIATCIWTLLWGAAAEHQHWTLGLAFAICGVLSLLVAVVSALVMGDVHP